MLEGITESVNPIRQFITTRFYTFLFDGYKNRCNNFIQRQCHKPGCVKYAQGNK